LASVKRDCDSFPGQTPLGSGHLRTSLPTGNLPPPREHGQLCTGMHGGAIVTCSVPGGGYCAVYHMHEHPRWPWFTDVPHREGETCYCYILALKPTLTGIRKSKMQMKAVTRCISARQQRKMQKKAMRKLKK